VALVSGACHPERSEGSQLSLNERRNQYREFQCSDTER
jgi:hypothetical protein